MERRREQSRLALSQRAAAIAAASGVSVPGEVGRQRGRAVQGIVQKLNDRTNTPDIKRVVVFSDVSVGDYSELRASLKGYSKGDQDQLVIPVERAKSFPVLQTDAVVAELQGMDPDRMAEIVAVIGTKKAAAFRGAFTELDQTIPGEISRPIGRAKLAGVKDLKLPSLGRELS